MTRKHALATAILVLSIAASATADPFEDGVAAHNRGDYATAIRLLFHWPNKGWPRPRSISGFYTLTAKVCRRTTPRR